MTDVENGQDALDRARRRCYLAVVFSDLSNSVGLAAELDAEDYADILNQLNRAYHEIIGKHGGRIIELKGDGVLACFGYPQALEDDCRRAAEAALDLHAWVRGTRFDLPLSLPVRLHTGIHAGLALVDEGTSFPGRLGLLGNTVNIAARLSDAAHSDQILVSAETLGAESYFFQTGPARALHLQGVSEPLTAYEILARAPTGTRFEARTKRGLTPFVGRQADLDALMEGLHDCLAGKPRYTAIVAPPGLGKTRLAEEFLARAAALDLQIHRGYCESYLSAEPLQPFLQMLRSLFGLSFGTPPPAAAQAVEHKLLPIDPALRVYQPALLRALSLSLPAQDAGATGPEGLDSPATAISALFAALAAAKPLVLFIDDWQWADDATRLVLGAIRGIEGRGILVVVATRESAPGDVGMGDAQVLNLKPLSVEECERTVACLVPGINRFVVAEICDSAGGNPLFVEELSHSAAYEHASRSGIGRAHSGTPWLDKLIVARVDRLPPAQMELVRTAAVIGNVIPAHVLESITGYPADHPLVRSLAQEDLIYPGEQRGTVRFKHGIARDVIYESVGLRRRRRMHLRIAETLRQQASTGTEEELYELLAYHFDAGGDTVQAARYAELAGDKAVAASALDRAQVHYLAALAALDQMEASEANYRRWLSIAERLALACVFDPSHENLNVLLRAVALATTHGDQRGVAHAEYWAGYIYYALGDYGRAIDHLEIALAGVGEEAFKRQVRATLGQAYAAAGSYDKAIVLFDEAIEARRARPRSGRPPVGFAYTLACKGLVLGDRGLFDAAYRHYDEAVAAVRGVGHEVEGSILCSRSAVLLWQGRWDDARGCALEAQRVAERVKSLYLYAMSLALGGYATWMTERVPASLQTIADATSWLEKRGRRLFVSLNYGWLAEGRAALGEWNVARRHAAYALLRDRRRDRIGAAMAYRAMARASEARHDPRSADRYLALAMKNAVARESPHELAVTQLCEAEIAMARGQRAMAEELLHRAETAFAAMAMSWHLDVVHRLQQRLASPGG